MPIFQEPVPPPPAPDVQRVDKEGRPTVAWVDWERRMHAWLARQNTFYGTPSFTGSMAPSSGSLAAAGAIGRTIGTFTITGGVLPLTWTVTGPSGVSAAFTGNVLKTTANPAGSVGGHAMGITITDALGATISGVYTLTLT